MSKRKLHAWMIERAGPIPHSCMDQAAPSYYKNYTPWIYWKGNYVASDQEAAEILKEFNDTIITICK